MNVITKTAISNIQQNKSRNILIGIAMVLTTILLSAVPLVGIGGYAPRMAAANKIYPTFHMMYRQVDQKNADAMKQDERLKTTGLRIDVGQIVAADARVILYSYDEVAISLNRVKLKAGNMPKAENEIVLSQGILEELGITADVGDTVHIPYQLYEPSGLGYGKEMEFQITGLMKDSKASTENKLYGAFVSEAFLNSQIPKSDRAFRVYTQIDTTKGMTTFDIKTLGKAIGVDYGVQDTDIVENQEYLMANYVDPALYTGVAIIMLIIILVGIMTIYSIYYVSMLNKIQEYGKMRAMGATKKQIRGIVFREGFVIAGIAIPIGVVLGCLIGYMVVRGVIVDMEGDAALSTTMKEMFHNGEITVVNPWIVGLAIAVSFITVYFSLRKPMRIASKISAVEAIRYHSTQKEKRKKRKGHKEVTLTRLTLSNLSRNKKRTAITILTLGLTSILFMAVATVLSSVRPEDRAREEVRRDYKVYLDSIWGDKMQPERELNILQMDNPLNDNLKEKLFEIEGVTSIEEKHRVNATINGIMGEGQQPYMVSLAGVGKDNLDELSDMMVSGNVDLDKLSSGTGVMIDQSLLRWIPPTNVDDIVVGNMIALQIQDGMDIVEKEFEIVGIVEPRRSIAGGEVIIPSAVLQGFCKADVRGTLDIAVDKQHLSAADKAIRELVNTDERLGIDSFADQVASMQQAIDMTKNMGYAFMAVLGIIGVLNLINTMINSVHVRKKELGILQAIGLSDSQLIKMLQMEGFFYTAGTLLLGLGIGNTCGYLLFLYMKATAMMDVKAYHYPILPTIALVLSLVVVQVALTYLLNKSFKKESLIERVRFSQ